MDRRVIDAEVRELRESLLRSPAYARIRKNHKDHSMEVLWRLGVSQVRFQKTLAAPYSGGDATVRAITVEKQARGYQVRDATTRDTFQRSSAILQEQVHEFDNIEKALERVERMMETRAAGV